MMREEDRFKLKTSVIREGVIRVGGGLGPGREGKGRAAWTEQRQESRGDTGAEQRETGEER
jgi:hypothetical protein